MGIDIIILLWYYTQLVPLILYMIVATIVKVTPPDINTGKFSAVDQCGNDFTHLIPLIFLERAIQTDQALLYTSEGTWELTNIDEFYDAQLYAANILFINKDLLQTSYFSLNSLLDTNIMTEPTLTPEHSEILNTLDTCYQNKPKELKISEINWKFAVRSVLRGENLLLRGESGCGKTLLAMTLPKVLQRPFFYFNMGATQDPRSTLIGNTHFKKDEGTYVSEALFVKAIQTPNAIILLDELSRAHPDAHNILLTVLDKKQRYLRVDESPDTPTVKVGQGVTFIATANVGSQYTSTRTMDRALLDRFSTLMLKPLNKKEEIELLTEQFPTLPNDRILAIAEIAENTRHEAKSDSGRVDTIISTRMAVEMAALMSDGFSIEEVAEVCIFPMYDSSGGADSPEGYMRALVQKYVKISPKFDKTTANTNGQYRNSTGTPW